MLEHSPLLDPRGIVGAEQLDLHLGLDRDVESHLLEVEVKELIADRMALLLLDHHRLRLVTVEDQVEHGAALGEHPPRLAFGHLKRPRVLAAAVDHAGNEAVATHPPADTRAELGALGDLQGFAIGGHGDG